MPDDVLVDLAADAPEGDRTALPPSRDQQRRSGPRSDLRSDQDADETFSNRIKKRFGKLTAQKTEALQQASYWQRRAMAEETARKAAEARLVSANEAGMKYYGTTVAREVEQAERDLEDATAEGDPAKIAAASKRLGQATAKEREVERMKADAEAEPAPAEERQPDRRAPVQQQPIQVKPITAQWMRDNATWYGADEKMTGAVLAYDKVLRASGVDPGESEDAEREYFEEIDKMVRSRFPEEFDDEGAPPARGRRAAAEDDEAEPPRRQTVRPGQMGSVPQVAAVRRGQSPRDAVLPPGKVRLSEEEIDFARQMGVDVKAYAAGKSIMVPEVGRARR